MTTTSSEKKIGAVCLGTFDGVHLGHQAIFERTQKIAAATGALSAVFTFYPHPGTMLGKRHVHTITTREQRARLIAKSGIDLLIEHPFTSEFSTLSPEQFVQDVLLKIAKDATIIAGFNYTFGHRAHGNVSLLRTLGERHGLQVIEVQPVLVDGEVVSSTRIRQQILSGDLDNVARCLGRVYSLQGKVETGDGRGKSLGFPTANIHFDPEQVLPPNGVYVVHSTQYGYGVGNLGKRPTFPQCEVTFEVHFFTPTEELYGQELEVDLLQFLRGEMLFPSPLALRQQVAKDIESATAYSLHRRL